MSLLRKLFGADQSSKECPRCLGKGYVDLNDIKRLKQELKWDPGACAYCNGTGKVSAKIEDNVPVDASYLVINLDEYERKRIINGHPDAIERGKRHEEEVDNFIARISYLHFEMGLTPLQIATFFLDKKGSDSYESEIKEFVNYVESIIQKTTTGN